MKITLIHVVILIWTFRQKEALFWSGLVTLWFK